jgi:peroxiredoxin
LGAQGLAIAVVLAQTCDRIAQALQRHGVAYPFPLLCDPDRLVIKRYGVWHPLGFASFNTAHPACFLIDAPGRRIRYAFVGSTQFARAPLDAIASAAASQAGPAA